MIKIGIFCTTLGVLGAVTFASNMAHGQQQPQSVTITLSLADLDVIGHGLDQLPRGVSEPVYERLAKAVQAALAPPPKK